MNMQPAKTKPAKKGGFLQQRGRLIWVYLCVPSLGPSGIALLPFLIFFCFCLCRLVSIQDSPGQDVLSSVPFSA